jgi:two-component system NtrC family sensor kinase
MNIRTKIISLLALLFAVLIVLEIAVQKQILMPSFAELERDDAKTSMKRIDYALDMTLDSLQLSAVDWGDWADVFHFVQKPLPEFVAVNMTAVALKQLQVNVVLIVDLQGNVVVAEARDLTTGDALPLDFAAQRVLPADFPWRRNLLDGTSVRGLMRTDRGIMMVAAAPVLDGSGRGPSLGMVVMGRLLNDQQVRRLGAQAQANLTMIGESAIGERLVETDAVTQVLRPFPDIYGKPLMTFRVEVPRKITARGHRAVTYASAYLIGAGVAALALLVIILNRIVLAPLGLVTQHAVAIGKGSDLTARLDLPGRDEVAVLAREFDRMVESVAESRRLWVDQSFQSGFAELAKGVMHNLGNAMTPLGVRLAKLSSGLRDAPVTDVELAAHELERAAVGTARHCDLQEFLRLGCAELQAALTEARADVTVLQRQTVIIQSALADLMRSTRNEVVVESMRLPDLVSQTLEIVPDDCRQRLVVETDDSLRRVGVVHVARTVLRLVLQNLIINAADAVRDAGRERGVLRVVAEIVRDAGREELHLRCDDDGVGIAKDHLERVFDQGFSTKSRATNHGIGLHWCANAIAALGGRIWAASDGPGRGTSMHLIVPLTIRARQAAS